ncbi:hypothetical protein BG95_00600 [Thermosipho sp. 1063]|uniref:SAVED domain-containing protein n=1 Tax=unclassified Thermosipho (in: thermotogales) TaxID=2676525 RepID=UPI0009493A7D|nr:MULTISPECIES: SAVED domain-containing protein [unclassified Thermosipho (in: thermotogales)]ANQ53041.1 hypothetical protein Y592_00605 [Thermosipho sp. 1070]APT71489.1 hypothetical protein BG95_00600 [Thermosipho sp. 1063]
MYTNILKQNIEDFVLLVKKDLISLNEAVDSYLKCEDFPQKSFVLYEIIKKILETKKTSSIELLIKLLNDDLTVLNLYRNGYNEVRFPIVNDSGNGKIARAIVFKNEKTYVNLEGFTDKIKIIEKIVQKNLGVIFDSHFTGNSFMLAITMGGLTSKIPKNVAFTGEVDSDGSILKNIRNLHFKESVCEEENMKLISALDVNNVFELKDFFEAKEYHVPVLFVFQKRDEEFVDNSYEKLKEKVGEKFPLNFVDIFEKLYDFKKTYVSDEIKNNEWKKVLKDARKVLNSIISNNGIPHIAIVGPVAMAMALGVTLGTHNKLVFYHHQDGEYHRVLDLTDNVRKVKSITEDYRFVKYTVEGEGKDCSYVLYFASHNPIQDVRKFLLNNNISSKKILIEHKDNKGNIKPGDWTKIVSEIMSITQNIRTCTSCENVHFFISAPLPIAFGLGMAYGDFSKGGIYQLDKETGSYIKAFEIENIRGDGI